MEAKDNTLVFLKKKKEGDKKSNMQTEGKPEKEKQRELPNLPEKEFKKEKQVGRRVLTTENREISLVL